MQHTAASPVLEVKDVVTRFRTQDGMVYAVNGISFSLNEGELLVEGTPQALAADSQARRVYLGESFSL